MKRHLLTLYTRTPLHVGSGTSVDVVDLPIMRERITGFPIIPSTSLKGVLLQHAREIFDGGKYARAKSIPEEAKLLFGAVEGEGDRQFSNAGCLQIMEAKILAFPVRSLAGCFAWITCPTVLERFLRDTGRKFSVAIVDKDRVVAGTDLVISGQNQVVLEEYAMELQPNSNGQAATLAGDLAGLVDDPLWTSKLASRLALVHDENFQHFVTTCTEVVARIAIDPATRTNTGGALFNQENVPCEALFYSVLTVLPPRRCTDDNATGNPLDRANSKLTTLLPNGKDTQLQPPILQIGGDETTGHGLCATKREELS